MSALPPGPPAGPAPRDDGRPDDRDPASAPVDGSVDGSADAPAWAALARVWAGEPPAVAPDDVSSDDAARDAGAEARRWLADRPDEAARLAALDRIVAATIAATIAAPAADPAPVDVEAALARVTARRRAEPALTVSTANPASPRRPARPAWDARSAPPRRGGRRVVAGLAAAGILAAVGLGVARRTGGPGAPDTTGVVVPPARQFATTVGQRDSVRLPDGTRILLGPATTVTVDPEYGATSRTVELRGEAYFHVTHDDARPFVVRAGAAAVRDLGTAFTVRHDGGDVAVAVTEGSVRLSAADGPSAAGQPGRPRGVAPSGPRPTAGRDSGVVLRAGDRGVVPRPAVGRAPIAVRLAGRAADDTAWTSGRLVFADAPLGEVAGALHRWYGVELRVADPALADRHLTATFRGEPLPEVLRVVGLALGARLERRGDTVLVRRAP